MMRSMILAILALTIASAAATSCPMCTRQQCMNTGCRSGEFPYACLAGAGGGGCAANAADWSDPEKCSECCNVASCRISCTPCDADTCKRNICPTSSTFLCTSGNSTGGCGGPSAWTDTPSCTSCCDLTQCGRPAPLPQTVCVSTSPVSQTWNGRCTDLDGGADCWTPRGAPGLDSVVRIPSGSRVKLSCHATDHFDLLRFKSVIVDDGAVLTMEDAAIVVTECFVVRGQLVMQSSNASGANPRQNNYYLPDPGQPEGTDCQMVGGGFLPRICGPGSMRVEGDLQVLSPKSGGEMFSSLFLATVIANTGKLNIQLGFLWGNVSNFGTITSGTLYMHGFLYNYATATLGFIFFDKWATHYTATAPLLIENRGQMVFLSDTRSTHYKYNTETGVYKALLVNYNNVTFTRRIMVFANLDIINYGAATWNAYEGPWQTFGTVYNQGVLNAVGCNVYLTSYFAGPKSSLGIYDHANFFLSHVGVTEVSLRVCKRPREYHPLSSERTQNSLLVSVERTGNDNCVSSYLGKCLPYHYIFEAVRPPPQEEQPLPMERSSVLMEIARIVEESNIDAPCDCRYSLQGSIFGDGSGAVVTSHPVKLDGTVTLERGGKWIMIAEHHTSPVWGGGTVRVKRFGELHVGIDATLDNRNSFVVEEGGLMAVPKHADVSLTNSTVTIRRGGILHIDGHFRQTVHHAPLHQCGTLRGSGKIHLSQQTRLDDVHDC